GFVDSYLQLEFDQHAAKAPVGADAVDELGRSRQSQPQFRLIALDLARGPIYQAGRLVGRSPPVQSLRVEVSSLGRRVNPRCLVVEDGGAVDQSIKLPVEKSLLHHLL